MGYKYVGRAIAGLGLSGLLVADAFSAERVIEVSGLVEVELATTSTSGGTATSTDRSDISLARFELGLDTVIDHNVFAHILLLYEEDVTDLEVDEGSITWGNEVQGFYFSGGQFYLPFGAFETNMIRDPLTLDLAQARESALLFGYHSGAIGGSFYLFNGDTIEEGTSSDSIEHMGFSLSYMTETMALAFDYISSIGDSDGLQAILDLDGNELAVGNSIAMNDGIKRYIAGISVHGSVSYGSFTFLGEYVAALDKFRAADFAVFNATKTHTPTALNLEVGMSLGDGVVAVGLQATEAAAQILPETRILIGYSTEVARDTRLAVELLSEEDYSNSSGGTGSTTSGFTVQLATQF